MGKVGASLGQDVTGVGKRLTGLLFNATGHKLVGGRVDGHLSRCKHHVASLNGLAVRT